MAGEVLSSVQEQGARQTSVLERIIEVLRTDERVAGAWLSGSFGRGEADEWSDFDLHVAVEDESYQAFLRERPQIYAAIDEPILVQPEFTQGPHLEGGCFQLVYFPGAIEVDWSFGPASKARKPVGHLLLFERRPFEVVSTPALTPEQRLERLQWWVTFFWAMAPIAVKCAARGSTRLAANQTDLLNRALICVHRLLGDKSGPDPWRTVTNRPLEDEIDSRLPRTEAMITPASVLQVVRAQCDEMLSLHDSLIKLGVDVHTKMPDDIDRLVAIAADVIAKGDFPQRKYR